MKKSFFTTSITSFAALTCALAMSSCVDPYYAAPPTDHLQVNNNGPKFKEDLVKEISRADRIVVLQHSHPSDFAKLITDGSKPPTYSYGSRVMSSTTKADFLYRVRNLSAYNGALSDKPFQSHHTLKFYKNGRLTSTMRAAFGTNEVRWNGSNYIPSRDIIRTVGTVIANTGYRLHRDWANLAKIEYKSGRTEGSGTSDPLENEENVTFSPPIVDDGYTPPPPPLGTPRVLPSTETPTARPVPGKPGTVFNPFTSNHVDVNGIPSGTKVRDPLDPNPKNVFRVP